MGENKRLKLLPVYDKYALMNCWGYVIEGVESVLEKATGESSLSKIFNSLAAGQLLLWVGFYDEKYCGFMTTRIDNVPFGEKSLWVVHVFIKPSLPKDIFSLALKEIYKHAKEHDCKTVRAWSTRSEAFLRKLKGWKEGYTEIIYTLKEMG